MRVKSLTGRLSSIHVRTIKAKQIIRKADVPQGSRYPNDISGKDYFVSKNMMIFSIYQIHVIVIVIFIRKITVSFLTKEN